MGRYGPMAQIGEQNDEEKPRFAKLKNTQSIETISLEDALELFKLPRNLGQFEGTDVTVNIGRFGPYIAHDKKFYSLGKEFDPYTIVRRSDSHCCGEKGRERTADHQGF